LILITGASGAVGGAVLEEVSQGGAALRAMYRTQKDAQKAPSGTSAILADFSSKDSLAAALAGVDVVFLVCSPIPQLVELESNVIEVSRQAAVKQLSQFGPGRGRLPEVVPQLASRGGGSVEELRLGLHDLAAQRFHAKCGDL
jgi:uncharacterized protein YbjT (DUF2867 family)